MSLGPSSLMLVAGSNGKVESCAVQRTSGLAALDDAACRAVTTAGIEPIKDASGTAVRAVQGIRVGFAVQP